MSFYKNISHSDIVPLTKYNQVYSVGERGCFSLERDGKKKTYFFVCDRVNDQDERDRNIGSTNIQCVNCIFHKKHLCCTEHVLTPECNNDTQITFREICL